MTEFYSRVPLQRSGSCTVLSKGRLYWFWGERASKSKIAKKITDEFNANGKLVLLVNARLGRPDHDIVLAGEKLELAFGQRFAK